MAQLIPVRYHNRQYPPAILPEITEVSGHFDVEKLNASDDYSLHTEYSYGPRRMKSPSVDGLVTIKSSVKGGIPLLWFNEMWAIEFYKYIKELSHETRPTIIEIHPPFKDYCANTKEFITRYKVFEESILSTFPDVQILIENRCGSLYGKSQFLISNSLDLINLIECIELSALKLKIALDIPQLITAYGGITNPKIPISRLLSSLADIKEYIRGIHLWGKKRNASGRWVSHVGDLNTYCENPIIKEDLLKALYELFNDDYPRYFVPEVNSNDAHLHSIVEDLLKSGFNFI